MKNSIMQGIKEAHFWRWFFGTAAVITAMAINFLFGLFVLFLIACVWFAKHRDN